MLYMIDGFVPICRIWWVYIDPLSPVRLVMN